LKINHLATLAADAGNGPFSVMDQPQPKKTIELGKTIESRKTT
jgi:hypothetical protein